MQPWQMLWTHEPPDPPFTVGEAHIAMREHLRCSVESCPRKKTAFGVLVDAGHIVPDHRAEKHLAHTDAMKTADGKSN